jgi:class 3 adenylate cyclase/pimeloyl-ACP methyl ester carboxylesterase
MEPDTRYASVDRARVAYQVLGEGPLDLVVTAGTFGSVDLGWEDPMVAAWNRRLASFSRLILFDRRGSGASDPLPIDDLPSWELYMDDLTAVMDAAGSDRAAIMGIFDAGPTAMLFAASRPERTVALVLANTSARILRSDDYPVGARPERIEEVGSRIERTWGTEEQAEMQVPSRASDPQFRRWFARYTRSIAGPTAVSAYVRAMIHTDARSVLPSIRVPTLILHRVDYPWFRIEHGRYLAEHIEAARLVELPGADGPLPWEHAGLALDAIEEFLTGSLRGPDTTRAVTTLLFTDVVRSTERAAQLGDELWREVLSLHDDAAHRMTSTFGGRIVKTMGDGVLATFDGPRRAIRASAALRRELRRIGLDVRSGIHTGEVEKRGVDVSGIAVHIAARVMAAAGEGEILVSRTVRDLIAGSEIELEERGAHQLKGVAGDWLLYALVDEQ